MTSDLQVLQSLQQIPKGKVTTYKNLALKFDLHPRKIALIMKYNTQPELYPCYKVISHSGKISGYSLEGGQARKIQKLEKDGIVIVNGKIPPEYIC